MAPKPKKMTDADKAKLKRLAAGKGARSDGGLTSDQKLELLGLRDMERKSRSYSPAPMSAAAKKKAAAAGKATGAKTSARKPKAGSGVASKIVKRAKITAREARDIKTALGAVATSAMLPKSVGRGPTIKNLGRQIKETAVAAAKGKKGTTSDINARKLNTGFLKGDISLWEGYEKGKKRK
jgi:hypothetical protein